MKTIPFTNEQIEILKKNPYTAYVTSQRIQYTLDFKIFVIKESEAGLTSVKIFQKAGYAPDIIGIQRIYSTVKRMKKEAVSKEGLQAPHPTKKAERFAQEDFSKKQTNKAIDELQNRIVFLEQELDFLKKTATLRALFPKDSGTED